MKLLILILIISFLSSNTMSQTNKECLHSGKIQNGICKCFKGYFGDYCERFNCSNQPKECGISFSFDLCSIKEIENYCPRMCKKEFCECGFDKCLNNGTLNQTSCSCTCPSGFEGELCETNSKCKNSTCENGGQFNYDTCKCDCFRNYKGERCEELDCGLEESKNCLSYNIDFCSINEINNYCPHLCKKCEKNQTVFETTKISPTSMSIIPITNMTNFPTTNPTDTTNESLPTTKNDLTSAISQQATTPTIPSTNLLTTNPTDTTYKSCHLISCKNNGNFNPLTCKCTCISGYSGDDCSINLVCSDISSYDDPTECNEDFCKDEDLMSYCPKTCLCPTNDM